MILVYGVKSFHCAGCTVNYIRHKPKIRYIFASTPFPCTARVSPAFAESFSTSSPPLVIWLQLCGNLQINITILDKKDFMCWPFCCLRKKYDSTWVYTFIVKRVGLKPHHPCTQIFHIRQRSVFGAKCLENERWDYFSLKRRTLPEIIQFFSLSSPFFWEQNEQDC